MKAAKGLSENPRPYLSFFSKRTGAAPLFSASAVALSSFSAATRAEGGRAFAILSASAILRPREWLSTAFAHCSSVRSLLLTRMFFMPRLSIDRIA